MEKIIGTSDAIITTITIATEIGNRAKIVQLEAEILAFIGLPHLHQLMEDLGRLLTT